MSQFVRQFVICVVCLALPAVLVAQGGKPATPAAAVQDFMRAVADSNLSRMAQLFGTAKGPAATTHQPADYEKRMVIIQAMLGRIQVHTLGEVPGRAGMRTVSTELQRGNCKIVIPVNAVSAHGGWLVHDFDLTAASQVNQPCANGNGT